MSGKLIDLKRRIKSISNTQKITKAMKNVAASKLKKSVNQLKNNNLYLKEMQKIIFWISKSINREKYPLINKKIKGKRLLLAVSSDKGLCGSFNSKLFEKLVECYKPDQGDELITIGKKISKYARKRGYEVIQTFDDVMNGVNFIESLKITELLKDKFINQDYQKVEVILTRYESSGYQEVVVDELFPVDLKDDDEQNDEMQFIIEPDPEQIFRSLIDDYVNSHFYRLLIESSASEQTARMIAMDMATSNATDMIRELTLHLNNIRQESITNELLEIISVTEAMNN
jgi:F-type H+-transporting ATPase subunit gamma